MTSGKPPKQPFPSNPPPPTDNGFQQASQYDPEKNEQYRRGVKMLHERCKSIQRHNERVVFRLHSVKRLIKTRSRDVEMLKKRLDRYQDNWRCAPEKTAVKLEESKAEEKESD
ncbi:TCF3 fusion partner [Culex pipiens pallens]|uniref:TCF3 fusion partner n=1 Tax=Culex pipiens pallens TaxID=42434 RepID=UPI001954FB02|nr:TCF3 fusion partner [Culex pipiens pallens]